MGRTQVQARILGDRETREYTFLVDTGKLPAWSIPLEEIEALGLRQARGTLRLMSATGMLEVNTYLHGQGADETGIWHLYWC